MSSGSGNQVDIDAAGVVGSLEAAAFAHYRHQSERWAFALDGQFAGLGDSKQEGAVTGSVIGLRTLTPLSDRIGLQAQGDVGGGANMDFTWQAMVHLGYQVNEDVSIWFGYRALAMEFDDSGGRNRVDADLLMHGPESGIAFHF